MSYRELRSITRLSTLSPVMEEDSKFISPNMSPVKSNRVLCIFHQLPIQLSKNEAGNWNNAEWTDFGGFGVLLDKIQSTDSKSVNAKKIVYMGQIKFSRDDLSFTEQNEIRVLLQNMTPMCIPVFLDSEVRRKHYQVMCKGLLWPVFHNIVNPLNSIQQLKEFQMAWSAYSALNLEFASCIVQNFCSGDIIWIHDYHLLLLPTWLNKKIPDSQLTIGLYIHTPFPSSEIFRALPFRDNLLRGILNADHIGFPNFESARHFFTCCKRMLGLSYEARKGGKLGIEYDGRHILVTCSLVGLDVKRIRENVISTSFNTYVDSMLSMIMKESNYKPNIINSKLKIISSVDPLGRLKGIPMKFAAFDDFLENYPEWQNKVVLVQYCLTVEMVPELMKPLLEEIETNVKCINEKYRKLSGGHNVIVLKVVPYTTYVERLALWNVTDVFYNASIRDGMNMLPVEYILTKAASRDAGVVVISETSGCSRALSGVLRVNPWDIPGSAIILDQALRMPEVERYARLKRDLVTTSSHSTKSWMKNTIADIEEAGLSRMSNSGVVSMGIGLGLGSRRSYWKANFTQLDISNVAQAFRSSAKRVLILDTRGTLFPHSSPELEVKDFMAIPRNSSFEGRQFINPRKNSILDHINGKLGSGHSDDDYCNTPTRTANISFEVMRSLNMLCSDPRNIVVVVSGTQRAELYRQFRAVRGLNLAAEHGFYMNWARTRNIIGGHDPDGNIGWELLGGYTPESLPTSGEPSSTININNLSGKGVWFRLLRENGGFHGTDIPASTTKFEFLSHFDVSAIAFQYYERGDSCVFNPVGLVSVRSGCTVTFTAEKNGVSATVPESVQSDRHNQNLLAMTKEYVSEEWMELGMKIMLDYQERTNGAYIEKKDSSLLWRFRDSDPEFGILQATELHSQLDSILSAFPVEVVFGNDYVEIRPEGVSKGSLLRFVLAACGGDADFCITIGDDTADETMFVALNELDQIPRKFTCTVGKKTSSASSFLNDHNEVVELLSSLATAGKSYSSALPSHTVMQPRRHPMTPSRKTRKLLNVIPDGYKLVKIENDVDSETESPSFSPIRLQLPPRNETIYRMSQNENRIISNKASPRFKILMYAGFLYAMYLSRRKCNMVLKWLVLLLKRRVFG